MRRKLVFLLVFLVLLGGGWLVFARPPLVTVQKPHIGQAVQAVYATGSVEPLQWARIVPPQAARLQQWNVQEGERVDAGQVLAQLDATDAQAKVTALQAQVALLQAESARQRALAGKGFVSTNALQRADTELANATQSLVAARKTLADMTLTAPLAGVVLKRDGEIGEMVERNQVLAWVGAPAPLRINAEVDEEDIARVKPGQRALIKADAYADRVFEGRVAQITPKGDPINKSYRVYVNLPADSVLQVGMTTEVNILVGLNERAMLVPSSAVISGNSVWRVRDSRLERVAVTLGVRGDKETEVKSGLTLQDEIVVVPAPDFVPGMRVR